MDPRIARLCAFVAGLPEPKRPPIVVPDGCATAEQIFRHVDPSAVTEIADVLEHLMEHDPRVIAAVADVDRTLIWDAMEQGPFDYLRHCASFVESMVSFSERTDEPAAGPLAYQAPPACQ